MKVFRVRCREVLEAVHEVHVPDDFTPPDEANLDDWAHLIGEQDSEPIEVSDIQIDSVLGAEPVAVN